MALVNPGIGSTLEQPPRISLALITSQQAGTTLYCPPPIPKAQRIVCPRLDVFSLGVITFELITKFGTKVERVAVLEKLNKAIFPSDFEKHEMAAGIRGMVCANRKNRWDCVRLRAWLEEINATHK